VLRGTGLIKRYKSRTVVKGADVVVRQGEIVGLLGPNGAGKTTTFYMITGLVKPNEGHVMLDDRDITRLPMYQRAQLGIGYLPQEPSVFRKLSVEDNILAILELTGRSRREQQEKLETLLNEFGLQHVRKSMGDVLSGGERRRTEIARALATEPRFILLDEPFAGVDPIAVEDIQSIVAHLKDRDIGVLITDHNVQETLSITDRAYLLYEGRILKHGTAEELAGDPEVREKYLGRNFELRAKGRGDMSRQFLDSLDPVELAYLVEYKFPRLSPEGRERVDEYLRSVFVSRAMLAHVFDQARSSPRTKGDGRCPRCGSTKLDVVSEPKHETSRTSAFDANSGGQVAMVERITCRVCDLRIADPNG
jgi:lipopolysaccharide export system ATP-binding protein